MLCNAERKRECSESGVEKTHLKKERKDIFKTKNYDVAFLMRMTYYHLAMMHRIIHTRFIHLGHYLVWMTARTTNFGTGVFS